jgi:ATP-dependent Clp protease adaptor protein ClpS
MPWFSGSDTGLADKRKRKLAEPEKFRVVMLNDDYTTMDFVVQILSLVFHKDAAEAERIMMDIHRKGRGVAGVYPWDLAQTKAEQAQSIARQNGFPLRCVVEKE